MRETKKTGSYDDPEWGVCPNCRSWTAWPGRGVSCDECDDGVYVPSDERGNELPEPTKRRAEKRAGRKA